jgi:hypothetical protein
MILVGWETGEVGEKNLKEVERALNPGNHGLKAFLLLVESLKSTNATSCVRAGIKVAPRQRRAWTITHPVTKQAFLKRGRPVPATALNQLPP